MDPTVQGALISAGSNILGGLLGGSNNHAGRDQRQATSYAIRHSVTDKVQAAKDAGISPLYALGAPVISASSQVGTSGPNELGQSLSAMGQDIGRAVAAQQTAPQREATRLALEGAQLDNDIKRASLRKLTQQVPPVMPIVGGDGVSGDVGTSRPDSMIDASGASTTVDKGVTPSQVVQNEYGDFAENIEGMLHYITDKFIRPGNAGAAALFGPAFGGSDPWQAGAADAQLIRDLISSLTTKRRKKYYGRVFENYATNW